MDFARLPFDAEAMLAGLRPWVECESPTFDAPAVGRMMDLASRDLIVSGARIERIAGRMGYGDCVRASFPHPLSAPGILVMGHLDTVHGNSTSPILVMVVCDSIVCKGAVSESSSCPCVLKPAAMTAEREGVTSASESGPRRISR